MGKGQRLCLSGCSSAQTTGLSQLYFKLGDLLLATVHTDGKRQPLLCTGASLKSQGYKGN